MGSFSGSLGEYFTWEVPVFGLMWRVTKLHSVLTYV